MKKITLHNVLPTPLVGHKSISEVWHCECIFNRGENYLIEATSGTGKSSLCSFIYGLRNDYTGKITIDAKDIASFSSKEWINLRRRHISLLFQELRLFPELTAWDNVQIKNQLTHHKQNNEIEAYFEKLDISDCMNRKAELLSIGQQQRVAFIRALCQPFDFILLDEPVSHVDSSNAKKMIELLNDTLLEQEASAIVTSVGNRLPLHYTKVVQL